MKPKFKVVVNPQFKEGEMMMAGKENIVVKTAKGEIKEAKIKNLSIDSGWLYKYYYSPEAKERIKNAKKTR